MEPTKRQLLSLCTWLMAVFLAGYAFLSQVLEVYTFPQDVVSFGRWITQTPWPVSAGALLILASFPFWAILPERRTAFERAKAEATITAAIASATDQLKESNQKAWEITHELATFKSDTGEKFRFEEECRQFNQRALEELRQASQQANLLLGNKITALRTELMENVDRFELLETGVINRMMSFVEQEVQAIIGPIIISLQNTCDALLTAKSREEQLVALKNLENQLTKRQASDAIENTPHSTKP